MMRKISEQRLFALMIAGIIAAVLLIYVSPLGPAIVINADMPLVYRCRSLFGMGPGLDPHIRIFAFDDLTVAGLGAFDLELSEWATVFETLDRRHPRAILIDKLFDKFYGKTEVEAFRARMQLIKTPIVIGSFVTPEPIKGRLALPLVADKYAVAKLTNGNSAAIDWLRPLGGTLYGAPSNLASAFAAIGNFVYRGDGRVQALYRLDRDHLLPHWGLQSAGDLHVDGSAFVVNGTKLPVDSAGRVPINIDVREVYTKRSYGMLPLVKRAREHGEITVVGPEDFVVILPGMFTGTTDWIVTPNGSMQGGFLMAAMVNSVQQGKWLQEISGNWLLIIILGVLGGVGAVLVPMRFFWPSLVGAMLVGLAIDVALFCGLGIYAPWILPEATLFGAALIVFAKRSWNIQIEQTRLAKELEMARFVQDSFVPPPEAKMPGLQIASLFVPATECGGDVWARQTLAPGYECIMIADATGHGTPAALIAAMAFSGFVATCQTAIDDGTKLVSPATVLRVLNRIFRRTSNQMATMTACILLIDLHRRVVTVASAGHHRPYIIRPDGTVFRPKLANSTIIGVTDDFVAKDQQVELAIGDRLILYTDGLFENISAVSSRVQAAFVKNLPALAGDDPTGLRNAIQGEYLRGLGKNTAHDDVTIVVLGLTPVSGDILENTEAGPCVGHGAAKFADLALPDAAALAPVVAPANEGEPAALPAAKLA